MNTVLRTFILASLLLLSACNVIATPTHSPLIPGLVQTIAAQTLSANEALFPRPTETPPAVDQPLPIYVYQEAFTPAPTSTPVPMLTALSKKPQSTNASSDVCVNAAEFIKDITIPDDTRVKAGQKFTKVWEFKNVGTCIWTPDYALVFVWGDRMGGQSPKPIGVTVQPGETVALSIELTAPKEMDACQGNWMFLDSLGERFGTGYSAQDFFWVSIFISGGRNAQYGGCSGGG